MSGYIGTQPVPQATQTRQTFVATAAQTSFATGGYSVGYLDTFLNGVKLQDGVDYTATNGSDIVLTVGAALDDTLEVVAYTTFEVAGAYTKAEADAGFVSVAGDTMTGGLTVGGAFTSKGIDDNATSTAMTLDSSGNVLVNKAVTSTASAGVELQSGTGAYSAVVATASVQPLLLNRLSTDGDIAVLRKDNVTVGRIGSHVGGLLIGTPQGNDSYAKFEDNGIRPATSTGGYRDGAIDLGHEDSRFKDLYLSGGVFADGREQLNLLNAGDLTVSGNYDNNNLANSVIYQNGAPSNAAQVYNGMVLYLSSDGLGGTHNDPTNERALQLYAGDTAGSGMYFRVKQGTSGWHRWKSLQTDWAALYGPSSYYGAFQSNWSQARENGFSMTASTSNRGITINESGYYQCTAWQRSTGTDFYIGIGIDGNRDALEGRTDGVWGHDHSSGVNMWSHSHYTGYLAAGEKITSGAASNTSGATYGPLGYAGALVITRLS